MYHPNSADAFIALVPNLNDKQREVLAVFEEGNFTDKEVAERLGWEINKVSGRIGELIKRGRLEPYTDRLQDGRKARVCRIISS